MFTLFCSRRLAVGCQKMEKRVQNLPGVLMASLVIRRYRSRVALQVWDILLR